MLFESSSENNVIYPTFAKEPEFFIRPTNIGALKINGTTLDIYEMVVIAFLIINKAN